MSRTRHHTNQKTRHLGEDLWSKRHGGYLSYCSYSKFLTRRTERNKGNKIVSDELDFYEEEVKDNDN